MVKRMIKLWTVHIKAYIESLAVCLHQIKKITIWENLGNTCVWREEANAIPLEYLKADNWHIFRVHYEDVSNAMKFGHYINIMIDE